MARWAITTFGKGNIVGYRRVWPDEVLDDSESFAVTDDPTGKVLADDSESLRDETESERDARLAPKKTREQMIEAALIKKGVITCDEIDAEDALG